MEEGKQVVLSKFFCCLASNRVVVEDETGGRSRPSNSACRFCYPCYPCHRRQQHIQVYGAVNYIQKMFLW